MSRLAERLLLAVPREPRGLNGHARCQAPDVARFDRGDGYIGTVRSRRALSNWLWLALVAALIGIVVWGWVYDFTLR